MILYHGSNKNVDVLQPLGIDFGNMFQKAGWSLFCFKSKLFAIKWAIFITVKHECKLRGIKGKILYNPSKNEILLVESDREKILEIVRSNNFKAYIYTIDVNPLKVGIGNDSTHDEYTIRDSNIIPKNKDEIIITEKLFLSITDTLLDKDYDDFVKSRGNFIRGFSSFAMTKDYMYNRPLYKILMKAIDSGELTPGDDIENFIKENNYKINVVSPLNRLIHGNKYITFEGGDNMDTYNFFMDVMEESCKSVDKAREFLQEVDILAKKYDANYYIVTDGASKTHNKGNPAVSYARNCMKKWEKEHGFDPDEDWMKESVYELFEEKVTDKTVEFHKPKIEKMYWVDGVDGTDNCNVMISEFRKPLRARSEIMIFKGDEVYISTKGLHPIPGGGLDRTETWEQAAKREAEEECRLTAKNIRFFASKITYYEKPRNWTVRIIENPKDRWWGNYTYTFIGEYDKYYGGLIDDIDTSKMIKTGRFYKIDEVYDQLEAYYQKCIDFYRKGQSTVYEYKDEYDEDIYSYFSEASGDTYMIRNTIYPIVERVLSTPQGDRKFREAVRVYIDKNSMKLHTAGPTYLVPFTDADKQSFFDIFNTTPAELLKPIVAVTKSVNDKANWKLLKQNPIFCLFYECIRYYTIKKDSTGVNTSLAIYALSAYPSVFSVMFKYGADPDVMQYTMDNLTAKYIIKQAGNIFSGLMVSIQNSYKFLQKEFVDSPDSEVIRFIARIRNDQKSLLKNIANNYYENHKKGLRVSTQSETYGDNQMIDDNLNNTSVVEDVTRKIVISLITNGVDMTRTTAAAKIAQVSMVDLRLYLTQIVVESRTSELERFVESILFIFLYQEHHKPNEINERKFLQFGIELFRRTNTTDVNVVTIKDLLQKWSEDSGVTERFKRTASRINYKRAIFMYIILCIQYYNS